MRRNKTVIRGDFFGRIAAACAAWALVAAPVNGQSQAGGAETKVSVSDYETVDLAVQDTDLAQVLQMLSIQSQKNIISSKSVSATVTANLFDVTFYEALDAILRRRGGGQPDPPSLGGELEGVIQEVGEDLGNAFRVGKHRGKALLASPGQVDCLPLGCG